MAGGEAAGSTVLESVLRRDRAVVIGGLGLVIAASWLYTVLGVGMGMAAIEMTRSVVPPAAGGAPMAAMQAAHSAMMTPMVWSPTYALMVFLMWWVMMVAMMLPSAAPMILLFARVDRHQRAPEAPYVRTGVFAAGYLVIWAGFSLVATASQWGLERAGLVSSMMVGTSSLLAAVLLLAAGLYQVTPLKQACLKHCRGPLEFVMTRARPGPGGAFRMGLEHGAFCVGCCWFLMALLFVGGVMNLYWIAGLALLVLLEKVAPRGPVLGYAIGGPLILWGLWTLTG